MLQISDVFFLLNIKLYTEQCDVIISSFKIILIDEKSENA